MEGVKSVGIWIRVSTEDQAIGESPEHHEKRARYYAESKEWNVKEVYHLEAVSGKSVMEHPETKRMLGDIQSGRITGLIFSKLARLARNTRELLDFADLFRSHNADLISLQESIDTSTPAGRLFYTMIAAMAQWEREEIASRVAASVPIRAKLGKPLGGAAPFGYQWVDRKLLPDPKEAPVRKHMYDLFLEHRRKKTVARLLNDSGYRTRSGSKFSDTTVARLLRDPSAKGLRRANYTKSLGQKKHWELKPPSEWIFTEIEPIVSKEVWEECNKLLEEQQNGRRKPGPKAVHLFTAIAFCECGAKMYVPWNTPKYVCSKCRNKIGESDLESIYHEQLKSFFFSPEEIANYLKGADQTIREKEDLIRKLADERDRVRAEMDNLVRLYQRKEMPGEGFGRHYGPLEERFKQIEAKIPELQGEMDFLKIQFLSSDQIFNEAKDLYTRWPNLSKDEKRKIVETVTDSISIGKTDVSINLSYLPSPSEMAAERPRNVIPALPFCQIRLTASKPSKIPHNPKTWGEHIKKRRLELGIFQSHLAELLDIDQCTVTNWEKHRTEPQLRLIPKIVGFLGYNPLVAEPQTIGEKLIKYRKKLGLSQKALAREIGIDPTTLSRLERNKGGCFDSVLKKVLDFLNTHG